MPLSKQLFISAIILYSVVAFLTSKIVEIHYIHIFNTLMLSCILFNLLDWKYGVEEDSNEEKM